MQLSPQSNIRTKQTNTKHSRIKQSVWTDSGPDISSMTNIKTYIRLLTITRKSLICCFTQWCEKRLALRLPQQFLGKLLQKLRKWNLRLWLLYRMVFSYRTKVQNMKKHLKIIWKGGVLPVEPRCIAFSGLPSLLQGLSACVYGLPKVKSLNLLLLFAHPLGCNLSLLHTWKRSLTRSLFCKPKKCINDPTVPESF